MTFVAGALSLLPIWVVGYSVQRAAGIRRPGPEGFVGDFVAGALGLALLGTAMVWAGWLSVLPVYGALVLAGAWAWRGARSAVRAGAPPSPAPWDGGSGSRAGRWLAAAAALVVAVLFFSALTDRLVWDGWAIWTLRAKVLLVEGGLPAETWRKPGPLDFAHPEYPLALPLLDWWMFRHVGAPVPALGSLAGAVWVACLVALVWSALRDRAGAVTAGLAALAVALFRPISRYAVGGTADVILTLGMLGAAVELRRAVAEEGGSRAWWRAAVYLSLAALAKNEGTAAAVAAGAAVLLWAGLRRRRPPTPAAALLVPVALGVAWQLYARSMGLDVEQIGGLPPAGELLDRVGLILAEILRLSVYRSWGPGVALVLLGYGASAVWRRREIGPDFWLPPIYLASAIGVYLSTPQDLPWLIETSFSRVATHAMVAAVFVALLGMKRGDGPVIGTHEP